MPLLEFRAGKMAVGCSCEKTLWIQAGRAPVIFFRGRRVKSEGFWK